MFVRPEDDKSDTSDTTSEDTSDKETEDSSTDDTEDTDDNDKEDNDEDIGEDPEIAKKYFADPASLPKELRHEFKKMQGKFTRAMQTASSVRDQAEAFQLLTEDPAFLKWVEARKAGKDTDGSSETNDTDDQDDKPLTKKELAAELAKLQAQVKKEEHLKTREAQIQQEAEKFKKDNPDWELYRDEMQRLFKKHPTLDYDEIYTLAKSKDDSDDKKKDLTDAKRRANTRKPGGTGGKELDSGKPKKFKSVKEAAEWTLKQMRNRK